MSASAATVELGGGVATFELLPLDGGVTRWDWDDRTISADSGVTTRGATDSLPSLCNDKLAGLLFLDLVYISQIIVVDQPMNLLSNSVGPLNLPWKIHRGLLQLSCRGLL